VQGRRPAEARGVRLTPTSLILLAAMAVAAVAFAVQRLWPRFVRVRPSLAQPRGSAAAGVLYAFTMAFAPTAKESASLHVPSYLAGIGYHLGIFTAVAALTVSLLPVRVPPGARAAAAVLLALGLACGLVLLGKRTLDARLRGLSVPDDFLSNLLVDATLAAGIAAGVDPGLVPVFQVTGTLLLLYAPLGKIRHMLSLLASRRWSGAYFGSRGVRPTRPPGPSGG
jgi:hypothetical protein